MANGKVADSAGALVEGEPTAWAALIEQWGPRLYNYLSYNAISEAEVQKLMHLIFSEVVRTIMGSLRAVNLAVLIFSVAHRHVLHYRRQHPTIMPPKLRQVALSSDEGDDRRINFFLAFYRFAPEVQQILLLHHLCEISLAELTQIVGQPEASLLQTLQQAELRLQA